MLVGVFENEVNGPPLLALHSQFLSGGIPWLQNKNLSMDMKQKSQPHKTGLCWNSLENLGRWFSLLFIIASIGVVLIYLFHKSFLPLLILGILLALVGILGMIVFGYGIYRGRINLQKVIDDFNQKLTILN